MLGIAPTLFTSDVHPGGFNSDPHGKVWVLASTWALNSNDNIEHFKWLIDNIGDCGSQIKTLCDRGYDVKIYCKWIGRKGGYGGPRLTQEIMGRVAKLGVEVYFDILLLDRDPEP